MVHHSINPFNPKPHRNFTLKCQSKGHSFARNIDGFSTNLFVNIKDMNCNAFFFMQVLEPTIFYKAVFFVKPCILNSSLTSKLFLFRYSLHYQKNVTYITLKFLNRHVNVKAQHYPSFIANLLEYRINIPTNIFTR